MVQVNKVSEMIINNMYHKANGKTHFKNIFPGQMYISTIYMYVCMYTQVWMIRLDSYIYTACRRCECVCMYYAVV